MVSNHGNSGLVLGRPFAVALRSKTEAAKASLQRVHSRAACPHVQGMRRFELTDPQWEQIAPLLPLRKPHTGRPAEYRREILNG